jgi:multidrug efflux pump subunit AcrB
MRRPVVTGVSRRDCATRNSRSGSTTPVTRRVSEKSCSSKEQRLFVRFNGAPAMQLSVFKLPGANTIAVVDAVGRVMARLQASGFIPGDIAYQAPRDPSYFIRSSIGSVATAALLGAALAMLIVLLFLGSLRKSLVIGVSIPLAVVATFAMMGLGGLTLNIISLGGLALGVGLLLDNSIVMLENIFRHRERLGKDAETAAVDGAREVSSAVVAATMTNLSAVVPFLLVSGLAALVFRELILTISFAIVASLAVALTVVPTLAALLSRVSFRSGLDDSRVIRAIDRGVLRGADGYARAVRPLLRGRWAVLSASLVLFAGAYALSRELGSEFLPQVDDGVVSVQMSLPPGSPPDQTDRAFRRVERAIAAMPHVESMFTLVGGHLGGGIISERPGTARARV